MSDTPLRDASSSGTTPEVLSPLTLEELQARVQAAEPGAVLVTARLLRRVIRQHRELPALRWNVPHRKSYTLDRTALLAIIDPQDLDLVDAARLPERVMLLERPGYDELEFGDPDELLLRTWRLLFHARIHAALDERIAAGQLGPVEICRRMHALGYTPCDEIRNVLTQEGMLFPEADDRDVYVEFAAVFLELGYFAPSLLPSYFPGLTNLAAVRELLSGDLDAEALFRSAQLRGTVRPVDRFEGSEVDDLVVPPESQDFEFTFGARQPNEPIYRRLMYKAETAERQGNVVRGALLAVRAERHAPRKLAGKSRAAARRALVRLIHRLETALEISTPDPVPWEETLWALLRQTPRGIWTVEARLLYDLQKVCVDAEREVFTVDVVEWALSRGQRPLRRALPSQRDVLMAKHLQSAAQRLTSVRLPEQLRRQLGALLHAARERAEERIREHFRPRITQVLDEVGLVAANLPEQVARQKLVEELLDQVTHRSYLTLGDVRDALSRNQLKLPDVAGPGELWRGDQLLQADRRLAEALDGVYHRGEFYLRWMQRLSAVSFGTRLGRWLTQFVAVPFGGAYLLLAFIAHFAEMIHPGESALKHPSLVLVWGFFLLGLLHHAAFRRGVWEVCKTGYRAVRTAVVDLPRWLLRRPVVRQFLQSRAVVWTGRFAIKPGLVTLVLWLIRLPGSDSPPALVMLYVLVAILLNSRAGRNVEEMLADALGHLWHRVGLRILSGLFYLIVDVFKALLEYTEQLLYSVDQWLRFRSGEGRQALIVKAVLGVIWFYVTYVIRFGMNLLLEPQINPIKHFPVVTVSHKLLFPLIPHLAGVLSYTLETGLAYTAAATIIWCIPGIFGFLVWELKENWRLYAANRAPTLRPTIIGAHGENMLRLLRPGFHSGTIPKRFAKLRRAERHARTKGDWNPVRRHLHFLQHVEHDLRRYVEREFLALLAVSPDWNAALPRLADLRVETNRVWITLDAPAGGTPMQITFEYRAGWLLAGMPEPGWSGALSESERQAFSTALIGLFKRAGVDLVRGQIEAKFPVPMPPYDVAPDRLLVWSDESFICRAVYHLRGLGPLRPQVEPETADYSFPTLDRARLIFSDVPVAWTDWIEAVEGHAAGAPGGTSPDGLKSGNSCSADGTGL